MVLKIFFDVKKNEIMFTHNLYENNAARSRDSDEVSETKLK